MSKVWSVRGVNPKIRDEIVRTARAREMPVARLLEEAISTVTQEDSTTRSVVRQLDERLARLNATDAERPHG